LYTSGNYPRYIFVCDICHVHLCMIISGWLHVSKICVLKQCFVGGFLTGFWNSYIYIKTKCKHNRLKVLRGKKSAREKTLVAVCMSWVLLWQRMAWLACAPFLHPSPTFLTPYPTHLSFFIPHVTLLDSLLSCFHTCVVKY